MVVYEYVEDYNWFVREYLGNMEPSLLFHTMLFPDPYPGRDTEVVNALRESDSAQPSIGDPYIRQLRAMRVSGHVLQQLAVVRAPHEASYDPEYLSILELGTRDLQTKKLAQIRFAWLGKFIAGLTVNCDESSPFVQKYLEGAASGDPKSSFWASFLLADSQEGTAAQDTAIGTSEQHPSVVGVMNYHNQQHQGVEAYLPPLFHRPY